jgi:hypothetical protein
MQVVEAPNRQIHSIVHRTEPNEQISGQAPRVRKVTIQLSEKIFRQLEAAIDRPGVGKSVVVEAALERFLDPNPPVRDHVDGHLDEMNARFERLERHLSAIAEMVALHARYHLSVMPPLPESQQREACILGDQRFKVLAEQVDRRVRLGQPLLQETIERLDAADLATTNPDVDDGLTCRLEPELPKQVDALRKAADVKDEPIAAAGEGGSNPSFRQLPNSFC